MVERRRHMKRPRTLIESHETRSTDHECGTRCGTTGCPLESCLAEERLTGRIEVSLQQHYLGRFARNGVGEVGCEATMPTRGKGPHRDDGLQTNTTIAADGKRRYAAKHAVEPNQPMVQRNEDWERGRGRREIELTAMLSPYFGPDGERVDPIRSSTTRSRQSSRMRARAMPRRSRSGRRSATTPWSTTPPDRKTRRSRRSAIRATTTRPRSGSSSPRSNATR